MKEVLQPMFSALQNLTGNYLQIQPGDLRSPRFLQGWSQQ
jgi:hypothetical protein